MVVPGQAPAPMPAPAPARLSGLPPGAPAAKVCPGCGAPLTRDAVVCTRCGYNLTTGQRLQSRTGAGAGAAARKAAPASDKWYANPNIWLGILALFFVALFFIGRATGPVGFLVYALLALLYVAAIEIWALIAAFKDSVGTGFLALYFWPYRLYFVFSKSENPMLKALYTVDLGLLASFYFAKGGE